VSRGAGRGARGSAAAESGSSAGPRGSDRGGSHPLGGSDPRSVAGAVVDPELPVVTLADLGVLRDVRTESDGTVVVEITPTYSGCPAMGVMRADLVHALHRAGFERVDVRTVLAPAWSTDWITDEGRRKLAQAGIAPPGAAPVREAGPVPVDLGPSRRVVACPLCGSPDTEEISEFGATACTALRRCRRCREPFEHVKEI
jgi:ring-1,2-phenylacetyl-CoA epoxidase subunit PaaD